MKKDIYNIAVIGGNMGKPQPVSISNAGLSLDVSHLFRTMTVSVTLMRDETEIATGSVKLVNGEGTTIYQSADSIHTLIFDLSSVLTEKEMQYITGVKVSCSNNYMAPDLVFDNLKVVNINNNQSNYFADFEDDANIRHYSNLTKVTGDSAISGAYSLKYCGNETNDNYMAFQFNNATTVN